LVDLEDDNRRLSAYLLGELAEDEAAELEQSYLADEDLHEKLLAVEDELAYDYLEGRLTPAQRAHYERTIGVTERGRRSLEFARPLLKMMRASEPRRTPAASWFLRIAAAAAIVSAPVWLAYRMNVMEGEVKSLRARATSAEELLARGTAAPVTAAPVPLEVAFLLTPGLTRGEDGQARLVVPAQAAAVRFQLVLPPGIEGASLTALVRDPDGRQVWSQAVEPAKGQVAMSVPAQVLGGGAYRIVLRRLSVGEPSDLAAYGFRVERQAGPR
jgi:hypothetical protein